MTDGVPYPALLLDWLTPVYDLFVRLLLDEKRVKRDLIARANLAPGLRVLDVGAGTGTLAIQVKQAQPAAVVTGLDGDPKVLGIAREKTTRAAVDVAFDLGDAVALPYPDGAFDRVLSSLVFSLLSGEQKRRVLREADRVLAADGELYLADFGPPHTFWGWLLARRMRRFEPIRDNLDCRLPGMLRDAGLEDVVEAARYSTVLGTISILSGRKRDGARSQ